MRCILNTKHQQILCDTNYKFISHAWVSKTNFHSANISPFCIEVFQNITTYSWVLRLLYLVLARHFEIIFSYKKKTSQFKCYRSFLNFFLFLDISTYSPSYKFLPNRFMYFSNQYSTSFAKWTFWTWLYLASIKSALALCLATALL